jgi:UDP-3-O-[3-hydroxymyristoyl] glucosamine N-acyltransferase
MKPHKKKNQYTLAELSQGLDVTLKGDPECLISGVCTIQQSHSGYITFLMNPLYKKYLSTTTAAAVILSEADSMDCPVNAVISRDPYYAYAKIATYFEYKPKFLAGIHPSVVIGKNCQIDPTVSIGPQCNIEDRVILGANVVIGPGCHIGEGCELGDNTRLDANVTLYYRVKIGKRVNLASGVVVGSDGFGIVKHKNVWQKVPQLGTVIIGDDVDVGANSTIDRGAIDNTVIERGVKLDNLVQIGHNVHIGEYTAIAGCVGIAGSAVIGKHCLIGGQAGIAGHITIADNVMITGAAAITRSIRTAGVYSSGVGGVVSNLEWRKNSARVNRLEQMAQRLKAVESTIEELSERK